MKMPLPPLPGGNTAPPALPPRRNLPVPPVEEAYDDFEVDAKVSSDQDEYDDFDAELPQDNYDEFEGVVSPTVEHNEYELGDRDDSPPPPPPPMKSRPPLHPIPPPPPPQVHEEETYIDPDEDDDQVAGDNVIPPLPPMGTRKQPELPTREKKKPTTFGGPLIDMNTINAMKGKLKKVTQFGGKGGKSDKTDADESKTIFGRHALKPVVPSKPKELNGVTIVNQTTTNHTDTKPKQDCVVVLATKADDNNGDDGEMIYDDAESQVLDPLSRNLWYHGMINRVECNRRIKLLNLDGTYLIRKSSKDGDHPYTLAVLFDGKIFNLKIRLRSDSKYALGENKDNELCFDTVLEVISHHQKNDVILIGSKNGNVKLKDTPPKY